MDDIKAVFRSIDTDSSGKISREEFVAAVERMDIQCDASAAFDILDVDKSGVLTIEELCFSIGADLLSAKQQGVTAATCLAQVLSALQPDVKGGPLAVATPVGSSPAPPAEEHDLTCCDYFLAATPLTACSLCCCSTYGGAVAGKPLVGMPRVIEYISTVKDANVHYRWHVRASTAD